MKKIIINIAKEFSKTPGPRFISDGPYSGEEFRKKYLEKYFDDSTLLDYEIEIILDGVNRAYPTSFLDEAFGSLARKYGIDNCLKRIKFISNDNIRRIEEIINYIKECDKR